MALTAAQIKRRIEMAKELEEALFLLFLAWAYEADEEEAEDTFKNTYLDIVEKYDDVGLDDDFVEYIVLLAAALHQSTMAAKEEYQQKNDDMSFGASTIGTAEKSSKKANDEKTSDGRPYFLSIDRASFVAANEANTALNKIEFAEAKRDGKKYKTWHTEQDLRVRPTHVPLDGKTIPIDEDFSVGGYPMAYPKDTSRAPLREYSNCRCSATYSK